MLLGAAADDPGVAEEEGSTRELGAGVLDACGADEPAAEDGPALDGSAREDGTDDDEACWLVGPPEDAGISDDDGAALDELPGLLPTQDTSQAPRSNAPPSAATAWLVQQAVPSGQSRSCTHTTVGEPRPPVGMHPSGPVHTVDKPCAQHRFPSVQSSGPSQASATASPEHSFTSQPVPVNPTQHTLDSSMLHRLPSHTTPDSYSPV